MRLITSRYLKTAQQAVTEAGKLVLKGFHTDEYLRDVGVGDYDINAPIDKQSGKLMVSIIHKQFPQHSIISEDIEIQGQDKTYTWYIDPLDGTNNFAIGIPYFGVSAVLIKAGEPLVGAIYNPVTKDLFWAEKGEGTFMNGLKIRYRDRHTPLKKAIVAYIRGHKTFSNPEYKKIGDNLEKNLEGKPRRTIKFWAPVIDYTLLLQGKLDAIVTYQDEFPESYVGYLMVTEAKIPIVSFDNDKTQIPVESIIGSKNLLEELSAALDG